MEPLIKKAVFLDRDGVINTERGSYTSRIEDFTLVQDIEKSLKVLLEKGYLLIVITNQSGIAKGMYRLTDMQLVHAHMCKLLALHSIEFTEIYFCPHHPDVTRCLCRKPDSLLLEKAMARFGIDPLKSFFIGDKERDRDAALKAGVKPILIEANSSLLNYLHLIP